VFELGAAVKTLDASNNRLATLPPALANLTNLQRLVRSRIHAQRLMTTPCSSGSAHARCACLEAHPALRHAPQRSAAAAQHAVRC
jgi:hypothetical protein